MQEEVGDICGAACWKSLWENHASEFKGTK